MKVAISTTQKREKRASFPDRPILREHFGELSKRARRLFEVGFRGFAGMVMLGFGLTLRDNEAATTVALAIIGGVALVGMQIWLRTKGKGLPLFPLILVQHAVIYGLPLVVRDSGLVQTDSSIILLSGFGVAVFMICLTIGWWQGRKVGALNPARGGISLGRRRMEWAFSLAMGLMGATLMFQISVRTGLIFKLLPGSLGGLFPVIRTFALVAGMVGALLAGVLVGSRRDLRQALAFWAMIGGIVALLIADVLLSAATGTVLASMVGIAFGKRRVPLFALVVIFGGLSFLNVGKFVMRERYWSESNITQIGIMDLPGFYAEWVDASSSLLLRGGESRVVAEDDGQSLLDRVDNFQNMVFVVEAIDQAEIPLLWGETYAMIPSLLVPRLLWPDKPRAHAGQILLNLRFGRQANVEQTEQTYIAWGLLPEAVGNFGLWSGSIVLGLVMGFGLGWLERVSRRKALISIEGMVLVSLMLISMASFEMVASVYVTAIFQALFAVFLMGLVLRFFLGSVPVQVPRKAWSSKSRVKTQ